MGTFSLKNRSLEEERKSKLDAGSRKPRHPVKKPGHGEEPGCRGIPNNMVTGPPHPTGKRSPRPIVLVLTVPQCGQPKIPVPLEPPPRLHHWAHVRVDEHGPRVHLPGPAQVGGPSCVHVAILDCEARGLARDGGPIAEHEVDCTGDGTFAVELAEGVGVECVLVTFHAAAVEGRLVRVDSKGDALVVLGARRVPKGDVPRDKPLARDSCTRWIFMLKYVNIRKKN
ncbi:transducin family protein / WD-40 repeat family protein [Striga asiatica]|uniref:Transducin family protein / WD-40 repeat family protein n=1 Tax=Striga asiatica TaxID=4170 RepID=A0A5A7RCY0_STRAF|nr:transducin family protein / WD-40 repeat family protein [Striga asiatica]